MSFLNKAKDWLRKNPDKANSAIEKVGDLVDKRTQGKYAQHVDKVQDAARKNLGNDTQVPQPNNPLTPPGQPPAPPTAPPTS
ncbi:antitoxin [Mycobacterium sp. MYCO198283]|uniref:antitoxin n=1 Tax=Mycobacterium sp. MYCO198283 TaxID=2883505 RepID=UPI001E34D2C2|nr:antitoxin [Mycobacterium sp. MYCO198283]MCG5431109.1 antitoxin [Mycobacterium sp. MYCO198283]